MRANRILWLLWLAAAGTLYLFANDAGTLAVLITSAAAPLLLIGAAGLASKGKAVVLRVPETIVRGAKGEGELSALGKSAVPAAWLCCTLRCQNLFTGETAKRRIRLPLQFRRDAAARFSVDAGYCGKLRITSLSPRFLDLFGLWAWKIGTAAPAETLVMPRHAELRLALTEDISAMIDSEEYSMTKPGSDPGETFSIREYVPGDAVKSIHWKLSQKQDKLMVREFGLPIVRRILILFETSLPPEGSVIGAKTMDAMAGALYSVGASLLRGGETFTLGWKRGTTGTYAEKTVDSVFALDAAMEELLGSPFAVSDTTVVASFSMENSQCAYAHVIVLSPYVEPDIERLCNGNRVSVLCFGDDSSTFYPPEGVYIFPVSPDDPETGLDGLEL